MYSISKHVLQVLFIYSTCILYLFFAVWQVPVAEDRPSLPLTPPPSPPPVPGAVIENMQHLGRGIYTGTFSGELISAVHFVDYLVCQHAQSELT
jgi:hypothetical protein